jgi:hypothetical protein
MRIERAFSPLKIHIESKEEQEFLRHLCQEAMDKLLGKWYNVGDRGLSEQKQKEQHFLAHLYKGLE